MAGVRDPWRIVIYHDDWHRRTVVRIAGGFPEDEHWFHTDTEALTYAQQRSRDEGWLIHDLRDTPPEAA